MMTEVEVFVPAQTRPESVPDVLMRAFAAEGLTITLAGTLKQYPGCLHWHLKRRKERGTLETTWHPLKSRLWFKIADGRKGEWIDATVARLKMQIEHGLGG